MPKVASKDLALAIGDYFDVAGKRYTLTRLTPKAFKAEAVIDAPAAPFPISHTVHNFGATDVTPLTGALHNKAEVHLEGGAGYSIDAADWEDGQSVSFLHTAGRQTTETLAISGFTEAFYRDGKTTEITGSIALGAIVDAQYQATITNNGGNKYFNIWMTNDGITGTAGIAHAYANATDRAAGTGYTPTADDVAEANLFLELSTNTLWRCTDDSPLTWVQVSGDNVPELTDAQVKDATSNVFGAVSGERLTAAIRSKTEQVNAQFSTGTTIDVTTIGLVKNQRLYLYSGTGAPAQLKIRFNDTFTKTVSVNGATGTTVGNVVTIEDVRSAIVYQEFDSASSVGGVTRIVCDPGGGVELSDAQVKDAASNVFGTVSGKRLTDAIRSKTEQVNAQFTAGTTIDLTAIGLVKNQRLYLYSSTGAAAQLKIRFINSFTKTVSVNGATGTTVGDVVTIEGVQSAIVYQEFNDASSVGGITRIVCDPGSASTRPVFTGVNTDQGLATWQANAKSGDIAEDTRTGTIHESRGGGGALRLTPGWIDRTSYTVQTADSIPAGLILTSPISQMNGVVFLRSSSTRSLTILQQAATTMGALFADINAVMTAQSQALITDIVYRSTLSATASVYNTGANASRATIPVLPGWYIVSFGSATAITIEPLSVERQQRTIHNFGVVGVTTLNGLLHSSGEAHIEGGGDYSIAASDWSDGQSIQFIHTAGTNTAERLILTGFAGAYLRDGLSRDISGGLFIGRQDCKLEITITENGGQKYLNIDDRSPDATAIWAYPPIIPASIPPAPARRYNPTSFIGKLVAINAGGELTRANAIAPNALAAMYYVDAWSDMLTPLYGDGKIFNLPAAVASAAEGSDLYLGAAGEFSLTPPAIIPGSGDLRQPVAVVLRGGKGITKFRAAAKVV